MAVSKVDAANQIENQLPQANISNNTLFRNIIINGDMSIAQRGTSQASMTSSGYYTVDRWQSQITTMGTWTQSQSTDVPSGQGFTTSLKMDCTVADATPAAGDFLIITSRFEGQNLQYLKKGTSSAESLILSFWVKSTKTGTFVVQLHDNDNTRSISKSYTVNASNTWEKKTITLAGDTTGTLDNDNAESMRINFWLGAGSNFTSGTLNTSWNSVTNADIAVGQVNLADSTDNDWYVTGVQLEAGTTASDFEFLPFDVNLHRCMRYYHKVTDYFLGTSLNSSDGYAAFYESPVEMRADIALESGGVYEVASGSAGTPAIRTGNFVGKNRVNLYNSSLNWNTSVLVSFTGAFSSEL